MDDNRKDGIGLDRETILRGTHDLMERYSLGKKDHLFEETKKHLHRGFIVRVLMIQQASVTLDVELSAASGPLSSHKAVELSILLNSFYLNLAGSMDNLAWALAYQYELEPNLNEQNNEHRHFVNLLKPKFTQRLESKGKTKLTDHLSRFSTWYNDLRTFRDPAAHRIPLLVHRSIYTQKDAEEHTRLDLEAAEHFSNDEFEKGREVMNSMWNLGTFHPVFGAERPDIETYFVGPKVTKDFENWYSLTKFVFEDGFQLGEL